MKELAKYLNDPNFLNIYRFGSRVYETNTNLSDEDYIAVVNNKFISDNINLHIYTKIEFQHLLDEHNIEMLECFFLAEKHKLKELVKFKFSLNLNKLRTAISTVGNGSWVRGKKKLTISADYNKYLGIKSIFHSLRILNYGIQIAKNGKILDYSASNYIWVDILEISQKLDSFELWNILEKKYRKEFNKLKSEFTVLCPKGYNKNDIKMNKLQELLSNFGIENELLASEIYNLFVKNN
ncbi:MAG: hypothetical protein U0457_02500 [Candidatus Sericytochromatia bacterium]